MATGQPLPRTFLTVVMIEGAALAAVTLLFTFDVIGIEAFVPLLILVALLGGAALTGIIISAQRRRRLQAEADSAEVQREASTIDGTAPGVGEGYDPMQRYRSPNE